MPRPRTPAVTYDKLVKLLGNPMRERADFVPLSTTALEPPQRVHRGWSWPCGCAAFARQEDDAYLYVPCVGHSAARSAAHRADATPPATS